jgi:hypothetical protein
MRFLRILRLFFSARVIIGFVTPTFSVCSQLVDRFYRKSPIFLKVFFLFIKNPYFLQFSDELNLKVKDVSTVKIGYNELGYDEHSVSANFTSNWSFLYSNYPCYSKPRLYRTKISDPELLILNEFNRI